MDKKVYNKISKFYKTDFNYWQALNEFYYEFDDMKQAIKKNKHLKTIGDVREYCYKSFGFMPSILMVGAFHKKNRDEAIQFVIN
ncbi:MAG: hypothetical protein Athens071426_415 [Parcubacteria group bacterium Athens0714_26]|nr:MAG: hypothetical protein Athens071426_415 [Parcubacteria group bacterium Athens0714_26]